MAGRRKFYIVQRDDYNIQNKISLRSLYCFKDVNLLHETEQKSDGQNQDIMDDMRLKTNQYNSVTLPC